MPHWGAPRALARRRRRLRIAWRRRRRAARGRTRRNPRPKGTAGAGPRREPRRTRNPISLRVLKGTADAHLRPASPPPHRAPAAPTPSVGTTRRPRVAAATPGTIASRPSWIRGSSVTATMARGSARCFARLRFPAKATARAPYVRIRGLTPFGQAAPTPTSAGDHAVISRSRPPANARTSARCASSRVGNGVQAGRGKPVHSPTGEAWSSKRRAGSGAKGCRGRTARGRGQPAEVHEVFSSRRGRKPGPMRNAPNQLSDSIRSMGVHACWRITSDSSIRGSRSRSAR